MGMRAATGAISRVFWHGNGNGMECSVIGDVEPRGLCGSGLVDAVAAGLDSDIIAPRGRFNNGAKEFALAGSVKLWQGDVRELQLAKAAIASGMRILLDHWDADIDDVEEVYLAGAFGNYVRAESAVRIGLLEAAVDRLIPAGNTALRGAKLLIGVNDFSVLDRIQHIGLASDPLFQERFVDCMAFPAVEALARRAIRSEQEVAMV
jgi:uncharacterized 2Fe-2S/4Fe-4S cluster protein (DUF4445 family)